MAKKATAKKASTKKTSAKKASTKKTTIDLPLEELLGPTIRAYAEEEARILKLASEHPKLGASFVHAMAKSDDTIPKKYRAAFQEAMKTEDVAARVEAVVKKMEKLLGSRLDPETKGHVRDDVVAMYRGD